MWIASSFCFRKLSLFQCEFLRIWVTYCWFRGSAKYERWTGSQLTLKNCDCCWHMLLVLPVRVEQMMWCRFERISTWCRCNWPVLLCNLENFVSLCIVFFFFGQATECLKEVGQTPGIVQSLAVLVDFSPRFCLALLIFLTVPSHFGVSHPSEEVSHFLVLHHVLYLQE